MDGKVIGDLIQVSNKKGSMQTKLGYMFLFHISCPTTFNRANSASPADDHM